MSDSRLSQSQIWPGWMEDNQQQESAFQDWQRGDDRAGDDQDRSEQLEQDGQQHLMLQRLEYQDWLAQQQREETIPDGALGQGLDRSDFYNIDTAHELEAAMERAAGQGVDYSNTNKFQRFLDKESEQGINQVEGKRSLSDRFQDLTQQSREVADLTERGAPQEQIPLVKLHESVQEQSFRLEQERSLSRDREQSPARERLAQIRQEHGLDDKEKQPEQQLQQSRGRGRGR